MRVKMKNRNNIRDFWIIVVLVYAILGFSSARAQDDGLQKGLTLLNQGKVEEAIVVLQMEMDKDPQAPDIHLALGMSYLEKGDSALAQSHLEKVMELQPDSVPASYNLAMLYEKQKNLPKALDGWRKVLALSKDTNLKELARKHIRQLEQ